MLLSWVHLLQTWPNQKRCLQSFAITFIFKHGASADKFQQAKQIGLVLPQGHDEASLSALVEGLLAGLYVDNRFKTGEMITSREFHFAGLDI